MRQPSEEMQAAQTLLADARTQNKIGNVSDADVRLMVELVQVAARGVQ